MMLLYSYVGCFVKNRPGTGGLPWLHRAGSDGTETTPLCRNQLELTKLTKHALSPKTVAARSGIPLFVLFPTTA